MRSSMASYAMLVPVISVNQGQFLIRMDNALQNAVLLVQNGSLGDKGPRQSTSVRGLKSV